MEITVTAYDGSKIYEGDIEEMPDHGYYVDIYEEAVNMGLESGKTQNGWEWETR